METKISVIVSNNVVIGCSAPTCRRVVGTVTSTRSAIKTSAFRFSSRTVLAVAYAFSASPRA